MTHKWLVISPCSGCSGIRRNDTQMVSDLTMQWVQWRLAVLYKWVLSRLFALQPGHFQDPVISGSDPVI